MTKREVFIKLLDEWLNDEASLDIEGGRGISGEPDRAREYQQWIKKYEEAA